jgi:hypothetical protein
VTFVVDFISPTKPGEHAMNARNNSGLNKIFGCPYKSDMTVNHEWEKEYLVSVDLPFPMFLAWDMAVKVTRVTVNRVAAPRFKKALHSIWNQAQYMAKQKGIDPLTFLHELKLDLCGGAYNFRVQRGNNNISMHAYGIAIDIDSANHVLGDKKATFPTWYIYCWVSAGFTWGGAWTGRRDSMHFEITKVL